MSSWRVPARGSARKAAERKEFGAGHVGDTAPDNASSTKAKRLLSYVKDGGIWTRDKCRVERSNLCKRDRPPSEGQAPAAWTCPNPRIRATERRVVTRDARNRAGNQHLIALGRFRFERQSCAKLCQISGRQDQTTAGKPVTSTFSALGGIRTPNLLIRRRMPPSQWVTPVPPEFS